MDNLNTIQENFPFLSSITVNDKEYVCIVQNHDDKILTFYDIETTRTTEDRELLLKLGDDWWWESNRLIPLNIFMPRQMRQFRYCIKTVAMKDVVVNFGPLTSLNNLITKRIKRKQIQLVRRI